MAIHRREAQVVLLDDGGVQRVEVQQQDELIVEALPKSPVRVLLAMAS